MTWDQATTALQQMYAWSDQKTRYSADWYGVNHDDDSADSYYEGFTGSTKLDWIAAFEGELPELIANAKHQAEQAYNTLTGGTAFIPGQQYVQDNGDGSFTTVVQFTDLKRAEQGYNDITYGGVPFVPDARYVQNDNDGTYKVVVRYPLDY